MPPTFRTLSLFALGAAIAACAGRQTPDGGTGRRSASGPITRAEMDAARYASLYDVVLALRGHWLQGRGPSTITGRPAEIQVIVDEIRMGGVEALRAIQSDNVVSIAFVDPVAATQRWGGSHAQGTIVVTMRADAAPRR
jgi:hypothetical protein